MNGYNPYSDEEIMQLLGAMQNPQSFQVQQMPQFQQGLLGDIGQDQQLQALSQKGDQAAAQMAQGGQQMTANSGVDVAQRMAQTQQMAQQTAQQQQQQQAQAGNLLGTIASLFIPGGSLTKFLGRKL